MWKFRRRKSGSPSPFLVELVSFLLFYVFCGSVFETRKMSLRRTLNATQPGVSDESVGCAHLIVVRPVLHIPRLVHRRVHVCVRSSTSCFCCCMIDSEGNIFVWRPDVKDVGFVLHFLQKTWIPDDFQRACTMSLWRHCRRRWNEFVRPEFSLQLWAFLFKCF